MFKTHNILSMFSNPTICNKIYVIIATDGIQKNKTDATRAFYFIYFIIFSGSLQRIEVLDAQEMIPKYQNLWL